MATARGGQFNVRIMRSRRTQIGYREWSGHANENWARGRVLKVTNVRPAIDQSSKLLESSNKLPGQKGRNAAH